MGELIVSVSGLRGIVGESLTCGVASRYAAAFVSCLALEGPIVLTRDGRASGPELAQAIQATVLAAGRDLWYGDVAATPTTGILVRQLRAAGGIQITASHNPPEYNGIKLFDHTGRVVSALLGEVIRQAFLAQDTVEGVSSAGCRVRPVADTVSHHLALVLATVDADSIRQRKFRVLLDANRGAGSILGRALLESLSCDVMVLGEPPDGMFEHPPEPTASNLAGLSKVAREGQFDVTFCQDPDADRLAIIDESGHYIGEEYTLAIALANRLERSRGPVVTNCSTSRMAADLAAAHGCELLLTAVGEANVVDRMLAAGAVYGGEGNGGPIDPRVGMVRDSFVGIAQVLETMAMREQTISQIVASLPSYAIHKTAIPIAPARVASWLDKLEAHFLSPAREGKATHATAGVRVSRLDGLRLDWPTQWLLVRPSNTEPIVRAVAEAPTVEEAVKLCNQAAALAKVN